MRKYRSLLALLFTCVLLLIQFRADSSGSNLLIQKMTSQPVLLLTTPRELNPAISPSAQPIQEATLTAMPTSTSSPTVTPTTEPSPTPTPSSPIPVGQSGDWEQIFSDEFTSNELDQSKWTECYWWDYRGCTNGSSGELEWYQPENVLVDDGYLLLRAREEAVRGSDGKTHPYASGMVSTGRDNSDTDTPLRFAFQYGYAEIRAKVPAGQGLWPAFWMLPTTHNSTPEIDVMEFLGHAPDVIEMHYHYKDQSGKLYDIGHEWTGPDFSADWHTFAIDWQPERLVWYVDGVERWRVEESEIIPSEPMYLILNLAVGGDWPGNPDATTSFPSEFAIDYVRAWVRK